MGTLNRLFALGIFAVLVVGAPLLFGASDRPVQVGLTVLLALGFCAVPPVWPKMSRGWKWAVLLFFLAVAAKEFLPQSWFGVENWREVLSRDFELRIPPTHNPEPARAVDDLLAIFVGGAFFVWVRTLAADARNRTPLAWSLVAAAGIFAVVCLACGTRTDSMIYGVRYTAGWTGYGAFPNRNHTAALLAMGALMGCGCAVRAARRKKTGQLVAAVLLIGVIFVAMVQSRSRGGLIGFGFGLLIFCSFTIARLRTRAAWAGVLATFLVSAGLLFGFGANLLARFNAAADGNIPNNIRWEIWHDTLSMWQRAPLFGFGLESFTQIYPFFSTVQLDDAFVLHPESSWLLWLVELGALPVGLLALALLVFLVQSVRAMFASESGFFLRAGACAAVAAIVCHSIYDVPAHRWAIAGFALSLLTIAGPPHSGALPRPRFSLAALAMLAIAAFWVMPVWTKYPAWSPTTAERVAAQVSEKPESLSLIELQKTVRYFPLMSDLYEGLGLQALVHGASELAWREFRVADKLDPVSWQLPATQAWYAAQVSPAMAVYFWTLAIERAGHRQPETFDEAYHQTAALVPASTWRQFAEQHPQFLTIYASLVAEVQMGQTAYDEWWKTRAPAVSHTAFEIHYFYQCLPKYGSRQQLEEWTKNHPEREAADFEIWAELLHQWNDDAAAWHWLSRSMQDPPFPPVAGDPSLDAREAEWIAHPANLVNAQVLAAAYAQRGELDRSRHVIDTVAAGENRPVWFVQKSAWLRAAAGDYVGAVKAVLRDSRG